MSKELEVHVNVAKQILWEFWQKYKEKKQFECVFLLMGHLHDNGMRVEIVKEKNLSTAKEKYSKIIAKHVYSLQKTLPETQLLGLAEDGDVKFSGIKCIENNERNDEEMHIFRWGAASREIESASHEKVQSSISEASERKATSPEEKQVANKKNADRKGFDNLFGKAGNKQKNSSASSNADKVEVDSSNHKRGTSRNGSAEKKKSTQKGGLSSFLELGKNQTKTSADSLNKDKSTNSLDKDKCANSSDTEKSANFLTKEATEEKVLKTDLKQIQSMKDFEEKISKSDGKQKQKVRSRKRNRSKETNNAVKKRKRIAIQSDSSNSEPSDNENESELDLPLSPESSPAFLKKRSISPPQVKHENGKRKVLRIVDKTFEEDGFLVTKKVHVYESCSEEEPEITEPKNEKKIVSESHSEVKGKKNTKQTTLMNFFKKS